MEEPESADPRISKLEARIAAAIASENPGDAVQSARRLLELNASSARAWFLLGIIPEREELSEDPVTCLLRSVELDPDFVDGWIELGYSYYQAREYTDAIRACETAARLDPQSDRAMLGRALAYQRLGNERKAIALLLRARRYASKHATALVRLAQIYYDCGHERAALAECKAALKIDPEDIEALSLAGSIEQFNFGGDCGLRYFQQLALLEPENPLHWQGLGLTQALLGNFEHSRTSLFMAHRLDPDDVQTRLRLGLTLFFLECDREDGLDCIDEALADCRWRNEVDLGALLLVPLFVLRNITAPGLLELTRKLRMSAHHLPEKFPDESGSRMHGVGSEPPRNGRAFTEAIPDTADYWFEAAGDSLLFERKEEAIVQLFRALEIHPDHQRAAAKLREINATREISKPFRGEEIS